MLLLSQKQALEELKQTVQQLRCTEVKFAAQKELLEQKVQENDGKEPPPVVNYEEDARSVTSMVKSIHIILWYKVILFARIHDKPWIMFQLEMHSVVFYSFAEYCSLLKTG